MSDTALSAKPDNGALSATGNHRNLHIGAAHCSILPSNPFATTARLSEIAHD